MFGMSAVDFLYACVNVLSSVPVPQEFSSVYVLAKGNWATCEASGFLGQFASITSVLYNASLTVYYMLTILQDQPRARAGRVRRRRQQQQQRSRFTVITKIEPLMHIVPIVIGLTTAIFPLSLDLYNPTPLSCTIVSFPLNCGTNDVPCVRGGNAQTLYIPLVALWVWSTFAFMVIAMTMIYVKIARIAANSSNHYFSNSVDMPRPSSPGMQQASSSTSPSIITTTGQINTDDSKLVQLKRQFATQALLYCISFAITWMPGMLIRRLEAWFGLEPSFGLVYVNAILLPLQGFWNAFVYLRPRYLMYRRRQQQQRQQQRLQEQQQGGNSGRTQALVQALSVNREDDIVIDNDDDEGQSGGRTDDEEEDEEEEEEEEDDDDDDDDDGNCSLGSQVVQAAT